MKAADDRTDGELYRGFLNGETRAYDQLMIRHGDSLTFYLYGYLHNWQDAEDLMIEAFARIMAKRPGISEGAFRSYLFRTGRNLASRFHLIKTRIREFSFEAYDMDAAGSDLVEEMLADKEREKILHECLERIDRQQKEALWLVYFEGMSYAEAASVMGVNRKKIDHLLERGKKHMRKELGKEGVEVKSEFVEVVICCLPFSLSLLVCSLCWESSLPQVKGQI